MAPLGNLITIRKEHWGEMRLDVANRSPNEACGLVAGLDQSSIWVYPIPNILDSPSRFRLDPQGQLEAMLSMEEQGFELLAIYHSHPAGPSHPSPTDIKESAYPETVHLIWHPQEGDWHCRGYLIHSGAFEEVKLKILGDE